MATLGQKLRELRHQKGYKLNEVAEGADLSISFISLIERDKASISVENLQKLANFYNVRLFQIFQDIEEEEAFVIREKQLEEWRESKNPNKSSLFLLSPEDNLLFKSILVYLPPASYQEELQFQKGEAFLTVKVGKIEIILPNNKSIILNSGDTSHLTSFKGTTVRNLDEFHAAEFFIVASSSTQNLDSKGETLDYFEIE
jgi:transcriptional regulator with XRE-family HTH domain